MPNPLHYTNAVPAIVLPKWANVSSCASMRYGHRYLVMLKSSYTLCLQMLCSCRLRKSTSVCCASSQSHQTNEMGEALQEGLASKQLIRSTISLHSSRVEISLHVQLHFHYFGAKVREQNPATSVAQCLEQRLTIAAVL